MLMQNYREKIFLCLDFISFIYCLYDHFSSKWQITNHTSGFGSIVNFLEIFQYMQWEDLGTFILTIWSNYPHILASLAAHWKTFSSTFCRCGCLFNDSLLTKLEGFDISLDREKNGKFHCYRKHLTWFTISLSICCHRLILRLSIT